MTTTWVQVRQALPLSDHLGRPLTKETPDPPRGPRRDPAFLRERNEMSRLSCRRLARELFGEIVVSAPDRVMPDADPRPRHSGWPRGKEGWCL